MALEKKTVQWNKTAEGFLESWLWQFGEGPFEVVDELEVPLTPHILGTGTTQVEIPFEPGKWYWIKLPKTAHNYRQDEIINCKTATFHSKYLSPIEQDK